MAALPRHIAHAKQRAPGFARILSSINPSRIKSRKALATLPLTRKSDGATASRDYERQRTAHGYNAEATLTRFNGETYDYTAKVRRGEYRVGKSQVLRNSSGQIVAARRVVRPRRH